MIHALLLGALLAGPPSSAASTDRAAARPAAGRPVVRASGCRAAAAQRCTPAGCEAVTEGLQAEQFALELGTSTLGACLYTDCFSGPARLVRDADAPWRVTAVGEVRSGRPAGGTPPPGSAPFALTLSVDLRDGRFTATWAHSPGGLQVDFGACVLER